MSISEGIETVDLAFRRRTWRGEQFTAIGSDYRFCLHRERVGARADGSVGSQEGLPLVGRNLSQVSDDPDVIELMAILRRLGDKWEMEDMLIAAQVEE